MRDPALWMLVDRVRDRSYDLFTFAEKSRLHNLVVRLKAKGTISPDDLEWLRQADENLSGMPALTGTFRRRQGGAR
jgi:hypothetical protein